jgi:hypothetical protein
MVIWMYLERSSFVDDVPFKSPVNADKEDWEFREDIDDIELGVLEATVMDHWNHPKSPPLFRDGADRREKRSLFNGLRPPVPHRSYYSSSLGPSVALVPHVLGSFLSSPVAILPEQTSATDKAISPSSISKLS